MTYNAHDEESRIKCKWNREKGQSKIGECAGF
jgi:hypothetical protein